MLDRARRRASSTPLAWLTLTCAGCQAHAVQPPDAPDAMDASDEGEAGDGGTGSTTTPTTSASSTASAPGTTSTGGVETTTSAGTTGDTTGPAAGCGDGVVDGEAGEQCDLGYAVNSDSGPCTQQCALASCGDGLVWLGQEQCDLGPDNNDSDYGGCREDCTLGPRCGDGTKQAVEECDASAPPTEGEVDCDPGSCNFQARVAFVTAATHAANLGGLAGADAVCATAAAAAGLDNAGNFLAYAGDGVAAPANRFTDGLAATGYPYARRDGQKLADDLADVFATGLRVPLDVTEYGTVLPPERYAWTGVGVHGDAAAQHCQKWSTTAFKETGLAGQISPASDSEADLFAWGIDGHWTKFVVFPCNFDGHIYCFED